MLWQRAACLARYRATGAAGTPRPVTAGRLHFSLGGFAAILCSAVGQSPGGKRRKDKKAKSPPQNRRGFTGRGCRYNGRPASKEAAIFVMGFATGGGTPIKKQARGQTCMPRAINILMAAAAWYCFGQPL